MRCIIPLLILMDIEKKFKRNAASLFDIFGASSFSSFIVTALNIPSPSQEIWSPKYTAYDILEFLALNQK